MKFLVDQSAGARVLTTLRALGHDAVIVSQIMPANAEDADILARAVAEERIIVTNDKDFGEMVFRSRKQHKGVLLFRLRDESAENRGQVAERVVTNLGTRLENAFTVASEGAVRIRAKE